MNAMKIDKDYVGDNTKDNRKKVTRADKIFFVVGFAVYLLMVLFLVTTDFMR